ncbi:MAG: polyprenyl synthetase family protein [Ignavibacteria bacterium]|jgi:geranylgeranyl diphosphate synthase type II
MINYEKRYSKYKDFVNNRLEGFISKKYPGGIYEPLRYILSGGGKRIRPVLLILSCEAAEGKPIRALDAALAVETLHNFTLIHDDIMDNADTRRGRETIHKKWDRDTAILSGDALLGLAYESLLKTKSTRIGEIAEIFNNGIIEVCEGQSYDKEFELRKKVSLKEYIMMINKKTSQLLVTCVKIGVLIGNGNKKLLGAMENYASNLGLAFQIQDDLLDIFADEKNFGKKIGGDIKEGKKTYLLLKGLETIKDKKEKALLESVIINKGLKKESDITEIKNIYENYGIIDSAKKEIATYTNRANSYLQTIKNKDSRLMLSWFSYMLLNRNM